MGYSIEGKNTVSSTRQMALPYAYDGAVVVTVFPVSPPRTTRQDTIASYRQTLQTAYDSRNSLLFASDCQLRSGWVSRWTKFDPLGLKFEVEGDYKEDDDGNRTYQDTNQQEIWDSLEQVRDSDWYNQKDSDGNYSPFRQMDDSDTVVNIESSARHSYFERAKDHMGRDTDGGTIHLNLSDLANTRPAMDANGSISEQSMSLESVIVHEGTHAFDWNYNRENYKGDWYNFFEQTKADWNHFPYHLEKRAVDQADSYRRSPGVGEPERRIYLDSSNSVWNFLNQGYRHQRMFREQRDEYNSSVAPGQRVTREHFKTGNFPR